jgi:Uma2 family endonuclease
VTVRERLSNVSRDVLPLSGTDCAVPRAGSRSCAEGRSADERQDILLNPTVIFEVVSPSTEHYDRGVKLRRYREIESLQDYILVAQNEIRVEQYTRGDANTWTIRDYLHAKEVLGIASIGVSLPLAALYERIEFPAE